MRNREMYNSSGCLDMTAYIALRNIERDQDYIRRNKKRRLQPMPQSKSLTKHKPVAACIK